MGKWASLGKAEALKLQCDAHREQPGAELLSTGCEDPNLSSSLETSLIWWHLAVFKSLLGFRRFLGLGVMVMGLPQQPQKADFILSVLGLVSSRSNDWD